MGPAPQPPCPACGIINFRYADKRCLRCDSWLCYACSQAFDIKGCHVCRGEKMSNEFLLKNLLNVFGMSRQTAMTLVAGHILNDNITK